MNLFKYKLIIIEKYQYIQFNLYSAVHDYACQYSKYCERVLCLCTDV